MKTLKLQSHFPIFLLSNCLTVLQSYRLIVLQSYRLIVLSSLFLLLTTGLHAQREADNWIFGDCAGLNFTTGDPVPIFINNLIDDFNGTVMSDSLGNTLFYFGYKLVWNRNELVMMNGDNILPSTHGDIWSRRYIAFPKPGSDSQYYIFSISTDYFLEGMYYSVIDMELDGGLGGVTSEKNIRLTAADKAQDKIFVLKNSDGSGYWVITRLFNDDRYVSFKVTENGVDPVPVYSPTGVFREFSSGSGPMRVSPDKKYLISCYSAHPYPSESNIEINRFDARTGVVTFMYTMNNQDIGFPGTNLTPVDCEISPDSKKLYSQWIYGSDEGIGIYQYDMKLIENAESFQSSSIRLLMNNDFNHLQLSNDGRIYFQYSTDNQDYQDKYLGIINQPWEDGLACDVDTQGVYLGGRNAGWTLPTILLDYLYRFEWEGDPCQGYPIHFKPNFIPAPDSIVWNFDELAPGSTSTELSPTYAFKYPGIHEVKVDVWYPTGRYEHTSREIGISPSPLPLLGNDTLICNGASITLNANCQADFFSWSTGQFGNSSITVSDTGTYWVRATFSETGCDGFDTIHIGFHPATILDESALVIIPTTCSSASGSITGLTALGPTPYAFQWLDLSGNDYGTNIDATGLPAGQYILTITDGNGCETESPVYTIEDAGNLQVMDVELTRPHCGRPDGEIVVHGFNPSGAALQYSIDDGDSYQSDSVFSGLIGAGYVVRVTDVSGCFGFYLSNPVVLEDIPGPQVTQVNSTDETDFLGNGIIEIIANGSTPVIFYSIDSGATYQSNNGAFNNLESGIYNLQVKDENGCDTSFTVEIKNIILTYLHAVTGEDGLCEDSSTALIPVNVDNFNSVANFHLKLSYNAANLQCKGFANIHPELIDSLTGWLDQVAGEINLAWNSPDAVTFAGTEKVADLVFTTKNPGQGELEWYTGETDSYFTNAGGNLIPAVFQTGQVTIYKPPAIMLLDNSKTVCIGDFVTIMGIAQGNQSPLTYRWIYPTGDTTGTDPAFFSITPADAGLYTLLVTDQVGCTDQKSIELIVSENPVAAFHGTDTLELNPGDALDAGSGLTSYLWNTGDTTESIDIIADGMYSVEMESPIGCLGSDSVYVKLTSEEIPEIDFYIPNAFSPNGDGINDIFQIKFPNSTFNIQHSTLSIYDRWGGLIVETDGIVNGWDGKKNGKDCPVGVYVYKIVFSVDGVVGNQERVGVVMLVR